MTWTWVGQAALALATLAAAVVAIYKAGPERRKVGVETVDVNVKIAGDLRDDAFDSFERVRKELDSLREDFDTYRGQTEKRLSDAEAATRKANERADRAEKHLAQAREKIRHLSVMVNALRREMQANDIPVPDHLADELD